MSQCARCGLDLEAIACAFEEYERIWERYGLIRTWWPTPKEFRAVLGFASKGHVSEVNHIQARAEGGGNEDSNLEELCLPCHRVHTQGVVKRVAKARRRREKFQGDGRTKTKKRQWPKRRIPSRPFRRIP